MYNDIIDDILDGAWDWVDVDTSPEPQPVWDTAAE